MASVERPGSVHEDVEMFTIDFLFFFGSALEAFSSTNKWYSHQND